MESHISENSSVRVKNALVGDGTGKISTFALFHVEQSVNIDGDLNGLLWHLKKLSLPYALTEERNTLIIYNPSFNDTIHIAVRCSLKSFFFINNEYPATITYYESETENTYKKSDILENITDPESAEEFISYKADYDIKFDTLYIADSAEKVCNSIINQNYPYYVKKATSDEYTPWSRKTARCHAKRKDEQPENV